MTDAVMGRSPSHQLIAEIEHAASQSPTNQHDVGRFDVFEIPLTYSMGGSPEGCWTAINRPPPSPMYDPAAMNQSYYSQWTASPFAPVSQLNPNEEDPEDPPSSGHHILPKTGRLRRINRARVVEAPRKGKYYILSTFLAGI